jgi:hypothetical protein
MQGAAEASAGAFVNLPCDNFNLRIIARLQRFGDNGRSQNIFEQRGHRSLLRPYEWSENTIALRGEPVNSMQVA